jgi:hypothetical protein
MQGSGRGLISVVFSVFVWKNDENFNHDIRPSRESNTKPTEYKIEALQLEPVCSLAALPFTALLDQDLSLILRSDSGTVSLTSFRFVNTGK